MDNSHLLRPWSCSSTFCANVKGDAQESLHDFCGLFCSLFMQGEAQKIFLYMNTSRWLSGLPKMPQSRGRINLGNSLTTDRSSIRGIWLSPRTQRVDILVHTPAQPLLNYLTLRDSLTSLCLVRCGHLGRNLGTWWQRPLWEGARSRTQGD